MVEERMDTDEVPDKDVEAKKTEEPKPDSSADVIESACLIPTYITQ